MGSFLRNQELGFGGGEVIGKLARKAGASENAVQQIAPDREEAVLPRAPYSVELALVQPQDPYHISILHNSATILTLVRRQGVLGNEAGVEKRGNVQPQDHTGRHAFSSSEPRLGSGRFVRNEQQLGGSSRHTPSLHFIVQSFNLVSRAAHSAPVDLCPYSAAQIAWAARIRPSVCLSPG